VLKNRGITWNIISVMAKNICPAYLMTMNLLAFGLRTLLELTDESYRMIRAKVGAPGKFFNTWKH